MLHKNAIITALLAMSLLAASCHGGIDVPVDDAGTDSGEDSGQDCPGGCPSGQFCQDGRCVSGCSGAGECEAPYECCDDACVNLRDNASHCGSCGNSCEPTGDSCIGSTCSCNGAVSCTPPMICCGLDGCVDPNTSTSHCGACNTPCEGDCTAGVCETCSADPHEVSGGNTCADAEPLGSLTDGSDQQVLTGNLFPEGDRDCFWFTAEDIEDAECDTFHVDIRFNLNPDDQFALEVFRGSCEAPECATESYVHYSWATDFITGEGETGRGECPCRPESVDGTQECTDNTAVYRFCVVRASGSAADCAWYEVEVSNGARSTGE